LATPGFAQCGQVQKLTAFDGLPGDFYGFSVAMSGDSVAVGARNHPFSNNCGTIGSSPTCAAGAVYTYKVEGSAWVLDAKLTAPSGDDNQFDGFGHSLSYQRGLLAVGALGDDGAGAQSDVGAVYVFRRDPTGWVLETKLIRPAGSTAISLGKSVSLWDDTLVAGATKGPLGTSFVYRRSGTSWSFEAELVPSSAQDVLFFGTAVALYQDTALIGAPGTVVGLPGGGAGAAYFFRRTGTQWSQLQEILNPNPGTAQLFGNAVAINGRTAMVGTPFKDVGLLAQVGVVYAYKEDASGQFVADGALSPAAPFGDDHFGSAIALENAKAIIGAPTAPNSDGRAYQFNIQSNVWTEVVVHAASNPYENDEFGSSVGIGNVALIGSPKDTELGEDAGAAYVFSLCP
jgi:hypothetical protein